MAEWSVYIDIGDGGVNDIDQIDRAADVADKYDGVVAHGPERWSVQLIVDADDETSARAAGMQIVDEIVAASGLPSAPVAHVEIDPYPLLPSTASMSPSSP